MTEVEDEKPTSIVFDHCKAVYEEMSNQARTEAVGFVYEGHLTKLFAQLQLSTPYYTAVMKHLKAIGCVEQLRRGGGNSPSRWQLLRAPDEASYKSFESVNRKSSGKVATLEQRVRDLTGLVNTLYGRMDAVEAKADKGVRVYDHVMGQEVGV